MNLVIWNIRLNIYDIFIVIIISSLMFGYIGGAWQVLRIISLFLLPFNILYLLGKNHPVRFFVYILLGLFWIMYSFFGLSWFLYDASMERIGFLYLILNLNIIFSMLHFSEKAENILASLFIGWSLLLLLTGILGVYEIITDTHFSTSVSFTDQLHNGIVNGIENKLFASVFFVNYNEYVTLITCALPYILGALLYFRIRRAQIVLWSILLITFFILSINASRGGLMCFVLDFLLFTMYYKRVDFRSKKCIVWSITFFVILLFAFYADKILGQFLMRLTTVSLLEDVGRMNLIDYSMEWIRRSDFLGCGYFMFNYIGFASHNLWIEILLKYGIFVFLLFVITFAKVSMDFISNIRNTLSFFPILAVLLSLPFNSVINSSYLDFLFFWVAIGSVLSLHNNIRKLKCCKIYDT